MKKWFIGLLVAIILILLIPIPFYLKDGGTVEYRSIVYQISDVHQLIRLVVMMKE